jgi:hypothetical protein
MSMYADVIPSPTTHNVKMLIQGKKSVRAKIPTGGRFVDVDERAAMMHFDSKHIKMMQATLTPRQICSGLGNTMMTGMIKAVWGGALFYLDQVFSILGTAKIQRSLADPHVAFIARPSDEAGGSRRLHSGHEGTEGAKKRGRES